MTCTRPVHGLVYTHMALHRKQSETAAVQLTPSILMEAPSPYQDRQDGSVQPSEGDV